MGAVKAEDVLASFLFVGDMNGHHHKWLGSTTTNSYGVAASDFATVSGCDQLLVGPTHARGGTLMTDVPGLVRVAVAAPICISVLSSMAAVISMAQAVTNLCVNIGIELWCDHFCNNEPAVCSDTKLLPFDQYRIHLLQLMSVTYFQGVSDISIIYINYRKIRRIIFGE